MNKPVPALHAWIDGIGFIAPGLPDWPQAAAVLRGEQPWQAAPSVLPAAQALPAAERRRASRVVKLALALGFEAVAQAGADAAQLATVFAASGADGHNCHALCEQLAGEDRQISPTRFHNSVHNAAAGYWGIASGAMQPCQVIAAFDASFGAGLLDALAQLAVDGAPVLLVAYDSEYPSPLQAKRPTPDCAGLALLLSPQPSVRSLAEIRVALDSAAATVLADAGLESLRQAIPALRALPLLAAIACQRATEVSAAAAIEAAGAAMLTPLFDQAAIAARIPHQGRMCLLDRVSACDENSIVCYSDSHRASDHPLRNATGLPLTAGVEYAAQAMALHGVLLADSGAPAQQGYLASVRQLKLSAPLRLDQCDGPLEVRAQRLSAAAHSVLYQFNLSHRGQELLSGRAAVILDAAAVATAAGGQGSRR